MRILVLVKEVPDTWGERHLDLETGLLDRSGSRVLDEINERALELAVSWAERAAGGEDGIEVVAVTAGPATATETLRKALALGADRAVHVLDDGMRGADILLTARVLAAAARRVGFDLVITGEKSTDGDCGVLPAALAELLDVPALTALAAVERDGASLRGTRVLDDGVLTIGAELPALLSVTEAFDDARLPSFKGIVAARRKPLEQLTLADLEIDADAAALGEPRSILLAVERRPPRSAGVRVSGDGTAVTQLVDFLTAKRLV